MASVYKRGKDKGKKGACWHYQFKDENGIYRTRKGFTDKGTTTQLANKLEREAKLRATGLIDPELERQAANRKSSIEKHLLNYRTHLTRTYSHDHARTVCNRIQRVFVGCEFVMLGDIESDTVAGCLYDLQVEKDLSNTTYNHYLDGLNSFCNWLIKGKRTTSNPLRHLERLNKETDIRHRRRALVQKEFSALVESARSSKKTIQTYTGIERARIYVTAYYTGLRRRELGHLRKSSFRLDDNPPTVTVRASISKHRKEDVIPINDDLVEMIREWTEGFDDEQLLFPKLDKRKTWLMVKKDLEAAGIPYKNSEGIADFHAAGRHTYITELLRNGVTLAETMKLARHSDVRMTMRYAHIGIDDQAKAVQNLPRQEIGRNPANSSGHDESPTGNGKVEKKSQNPDETDDSGSKSHGSSIVVKDGQKRRTRGSNPQPIAGQLISNQPASHSLILHCHSVNTAYNDGSG